MFILEFLRNFWTAYVVGAKVQINISDIQKGMLNLVAQLKNILNPAGARSGGYPETDKYNLAFLISKNKAEFEKLYLIMSDSFQSFFESLISEPIFSNLSNVSLQYIKSLSDKVTKAQSESKVSQPSQAGNRVQAKPEPKLDQNPIVKIAAQTQHRFIP